MRTRESTHHGFPEQTLHSAEYWIASLHRHLRFAEDASVSLLDTAALDRVDNIRERTAKTGFLIAAPTSICGARSVTTGFERTSSFSQSRSRSRLFARVASVSPSLIARLPSADCPPTWSAVVEALTKEDSPSSPRGPLPHSLSLPVPSAFRIPVFIPVFCWHG